MDRIQSCNFNFTINRQDVNEFGKLARIDSIINEPPTVGLDFSYYVTDGYNERLLGFNVTGVVDGQAPVALQLIQIQLLMRNVFLVYYQIFKVITTIFLQLTKAKM